MDSVGVVQTILIAAKVFKAGISKFLPRAAKGRAVLPSEQRPIACVEYLKETQIYFQTFISICIHINNREQNWVVDRSVNHNRPDRVRFLKIKSSLDFPR